jgi:hypothetical protein
MNGSTTFFQRPPSATVRADLMNAQFSPDPCTAVKDARVVAPAGGPSTVPSPGDRGGRTPLRRACWDADRTVIPGT